MYKQIQISIAGAAELKLCTSNKSKAAPSFILK